MPRASAASRSSDGLMKVGGAALAVTVVTYFAFPESYIFFGILHCIAVSSVLALPFLRLHPALTLAAAVFCLVAPRIFTNPALDAPWLDWLGLGASDPVTNDYVPIFPWFGLALIGVAAGRLMLPRRETIGLARWRAEDVLSRAIGLGRAQEPADLSDSSDRSDRHSLWRRTDCRTEHVGRLPKDLSGAEREPGPLPFGLLVHRSAGARAGSLATAYRRHGRRRGQYPHLACRTAMHAPKSAVVNRDRFITEHCHSGAAQQSPESINTTKYSRNSAAIVSLYPALSAFMDSGLSFHSPRNDSGYAS